MSAADDTIILNRGVGGDTTDATAVTDTSGATIKRERVVIGGDAARAQVLDLTQPNTQYQLPVNDATVSDLLALILKESRRQTALLRLTLGRLGESHVDTKTLDTLGGD